MSQLTEAFQRLFPEPSRKIDMNAIRRTTVVPEMRSIDEVNRTMRIVSSTERVDRYGDVIISAGFKTADYMKAGGPILWAHDARSNPPIAKTLDIGVEATPPALVQTIQFADKATSPFAEQIFRLYAQKFLTSFSVGFRPLEAPEPIIDEATGSLQGFTFNSVDLIEVSAVAAPANPDCVARAIESGIVTRADVSKVFVDEHEDLREEFGARLAVLEMEMSTLKGEVGRLLRNAGVTSLGDLEALLLKGE